MSSAGIPGPRPALPSVRLRGRRRSTAALWSSFGLHGALAGLLVLLATVRPSGAPQPPPKPLSTPIPITMMAPMPTGKPLPTPLGDLPVKASPSPTPTPTPQPTPTPIATPRPTPKPTQTPKPSPKPTATPTARPTARPTPKPTPTPTPKPAATPKETTKVEQRKFATMRRFFDYYKGMSDAELRKQPMPPGVKTWDDVIGIAKALDLLPEFVPPPTNASPDPQAPSPQPSPSPTGSPAPRPSPLEYDEADGTHALALQVNDGTVLTIHWKTEDASTAAVTFQPADGTKPAGTFDVPYLADHGKLVIEALQGYVDRRQVVPSPGSGPSAKPS